MRSKHISQHQGNRYLPSPTPSQCQRRRHELAKADGAHATDQGIAPELLPSAEKMWLKLTKIVAFYGFLMVSVVSYPQIFFFPNMDSHGTLSSRHANNNGFTRSSKRLLYSSPVSAIWAKACAGFGNAADKSDDSDEIHVLLRFFSFRWIVIIVCWLHHV